MLHEVVRRRSRRSVKVRVRSERVRWRWRWSTSPLTTVAVLEVVSHFVLSLSSSWKNRTIRARNRSGRSSRRRPVIWMVIKYAMVCVRNRSCSAVALIVSIVEVATVRFSPSVVASVMISSAVVLPVRFSSSIVVNVRLPSRKVLSAGVPSSIVLTVGWFSSSVVVVRTTIAAIMIRRRSTSTTAASSSEMVSVTPRISTTMVMVVTMVFFNRSHCHPSLCQIGPVHLLWWQILVSTPWIHIFN